MMCSIPTATSQNATFTFTEYLEELQSIQSQVHSLSEHLDLLDGIIKPDDKHRGPADMGEALRYELWCAIAKGDDKAVAHILQKVPDGVNAEALCLAISYYNPVVFHLLLKRYPKADRYVFTEPLYRAAKAGHMDAIERLLAFGVDPQGGKCCIHATPLTGAASGGHLNIVRFLVGLKGVNINGNGYKSPLSRALKHHHKDIIIYLLQAGADAPDNDDLYHLDNAIILRQFDSFSAFVRPVNSTFYAIEGSTEGGSADLQTQERRNTTLRLIAKIGSLLRKLLSAILLKSAPAHLTSFMSWVGTCPSVFRDGTLAIREVIKGAMQSSLSSIFSALLVASAMHSVVPPSKLVYSKADFVNDIPRWAAFLKEADQALFSEITTYLWAPPSPETAQEGVVTLSRTVPMFFQILAHNFVTTGQGSGNSFGSSGLHGLRRQDPSVARDTHASTSHIPSTERDGLPSIGVGAILPVPDHASPDPERRLRSLDHINVLMGSSIFGTMLHYLYLSKYSLSTLHQPDIRSNIKARYSPTEIVFRNRLLLAKYMGSSYPLDSGRLRRSTQLLLQPAMVKQVFADSRLRERAQMQMEGVQSAYVEDQRTMTTSPIMAGATIEDAAAHHSSPSPSSSHVTMQPFGSVTPPRPSTTTAGAAINWGNMPRLAGGRVACDVVGCSVTFAPGHSQHGNFNRHKRNLNLHKKNKGGGGEGV